MGLKKDGEQVAPYQFPHRFERAVVFYACTDVRFYGRAGMDCDPRALADPIHRLALEAARACAADLGHGPGSALLVVQRLARWKADGKVTHQQVLDVDELMELCEGDGVGSDIEGVLSELVPVLKQRMWDKGTRDLLTASAKGDSDAIDRVERDLARARSLGIADCTVGTKVSLASYDEIVAARHMDRLPFAIDAVDVLLDGGVPRGTLSVFLGDQKSGKSILCSHIVSGAMKRRQCVAYASLENPRHVVLARLKANLTGVPTNTLLSGDTRVSREVMERLAPNLGPCYVQNFPAKKTSVRDLKEWVANIHQTEGRKVDVLVIDYLDKCRSPSTSGGRKGDGDGLYQGMGNVFEETRCWAEEEGFWAMSPTQSTGRNQARGKHKGGQGGSPSFARDVLDMGDEADSVEKSRVADLFMTLNPRDEGRSILFYIAGYRHGESRRSAGPIPVDFACGRIAPVDAQPASLEEW